MKWPYRKNKKQNDEDGSANWMTTYSDLMTLLLVFFVLLYSFSVIDVKKFERFVVSFQGVGVLNRGAEPLDKPAEHTYEVPSKQQETLQDISKPDPLYEIYLEIQQYLEANDLDVKIKVRYSKSGLALEINDEILFASGKADLKPEAIKILKDLSGFMKELPYVFSIEGHTDNRPIHNAEFDSNWELSATRAVKVVRYLTEDLNLDPRKFCAVGHGEYRPVAPNDTPENMAKNRRVTIFISRDFSLTEETIDLREDTVEDLRSEGVEEDAIR